MSEGKTLYELLGGPEVIEKVVDRFYEKVLADETVNGFFIHTDMKKQKDHQTKFISFALGGPNQYKGKSMEKAHEGMNLQPEHFNAIKQHLGDTLSEFHVPYEHIQTVLNHIETVRDDVLYK